MVYVCETSAHIGIRFGFDRLELESKDRKKKNRNINVISLRLRFSAFTSIVKMKENESKKENDRVR